MLLNNSSISCVVKWHESAKSNYAICGNEWIGFESVKSIAYKVTND